MIFHDLPWRKCNSIHANKQPNMHARSLSSLDQLYSLRLSMIVTAMHAMFILILTLSFSVSYIKNRSQTQSLNLFLAFNPYNYYYECFNIIETTTMHELVNASMFCFCFFQSICLVRHANQHLHYYPYWWILESTGVAPRPPAAPAPNAHRCGVWWSTPLTMGLCRVAFIFPVCGFAPIHAKLDCINRQSKLT